MTNQRTMQYEMMNVFEKYSEKIAIEYGNKSITYKELDEKSNITANYILNQGISKGTFIGVLINDKLSMINTIIGIMKAGCVFVPMDSAYPDERIKNMLLASELKVAFVDYQNKERLNKESLNIYKIDEEFYRENSEYTYAPEVHYSPEDKIYVYFTSGTTGKPKGILGKNISLLQFIKWEIKEFGINSDFRISQFTSQCHDPFMRDIFTALCSGATICIPQTKELILDTESLINWINDSEVNLIHCTPSLFKVFNSDKLNNDFIMLKYVLLAGEKVTPNEVKKWYEKFGDRIQLVNLYGPTETTLAKLFYRVKQEDGNRENIPIGKPISGAKVVILDKNMNVSGKGKVGEIYIRTPYRSYGYYNDEDKNHERFIVNPFNNNPTDIIYKTGDLGRVNENGDIEFVGRVDRQIKIRGFRVELNGIENVLLRNKNIKDAVVVYKNIKNEENAICAYIVKEDDSLIKIDEIKKYLKESLPSYMIPAFFMFLEKLPLNNNGKIDYSNLPLFAFDDREYTAPKNDIQKKLQDIFESVLGIDKISIDLGFLDAGGHSLNAMKLISKIYKEFGYNISLKDVFNNPTIEDLSKIVNESNGKYDLNIEKAPEKEYYPLSSAQNRMFILNRLDDKSTNYNMPLIFEVEGKLDKQSFENAINTIIENHESFRTSFKVIDGKPVQKIDKNVDFNISYLDLEDKNIDTIIDDFIRPFDLGTAPLLRVCIVKIEGNKYLLLTDMHHIIMDGVSRRLMLTEFSKLYMGDNLPELNLQYRDYAVWQNNMIETENYKKQGEYWIDKFSDEIPVLNLETDFKRPPVQSFEGNNIEFVINSRLTKSLNDIAKNNKATLYMVLLASYNILLYKYTNQEDIIVGTPTAGRNHSDLENILGMFVNTIAMRNYPSGEKTFIEFLKEVKENALQAFQNQDFQFDELVDKLELKRNTSRNPLFDTMFVLQNMEQSELLLEGLNISPYKFKNIISKFDLLLNAVEANTQLHCILQYCSKLFKHETIERFLKHFLNLLDDITKYPNKKLKDLSIVTNQEIDIIRSFNQEHDKFPTETIHELFEKQVEKTPNGIAVVENDVKVTYSELNERANRLARALSEKGIRANNIVGLFINRSIDGIVGVLAALKAGGGILILDSKLPQSRLDYMIKDAEVKVLLTNNENKDKFDIKNIDVININDIKTDAYESSNLNVPSNALDIFYLIYTSGTTGLPKGVMVNHRTIVNLVHHQNKYTNLEFCKKRVPHFAALSFDACYQEICSTLLNGGALYVVNDTVKHDIDQFLEFLNINRIETMILPTAYFRLLSNYDKYAGKLPDSINHIIVAGEQLLIPDNLKKILRDKKIYIHNHYGPSETHVITTYTIDFAQNIPSIPCIGKPIANNDIYILDKYDSIQPVGVPGELCMACDFLSQGYINSDELMKKKFVMDPFNNKQRMYRTGDLSRWMPDGNIEYLGRIDNQVKIRGFRIELGEIESKLESNSKIDQAVVIAKQEQDMDKYLCAYIVKKEEISTAQMRDYLQQKLPEYMIPSCFVELDKIPINKNGKVDKRKLPEPTAVLDENSDYTAPSSDTEKRFAQIWQEVLKTKSLISIHDDFFKLGGHSLRAIALSAKVYESFGVELPLQEIFKAPTLKAMARYLDSTDKGVYNLLEKIEKRDYYPLSSAQYRMYILNRYNEESIAYNMPFALRIDGNLDIDKLEKVFNKIVKRHESLRTSFKIIDGKPVQIVNDDIEFKIKYTDNRLKHDTLINNFVKPFDLGRAPLFRIEIAKIDESSHLLMMDMHHIISDGVSLGILVSEFTKLYNDEKLETVELQYKDFAVWQKRLLESEALSKQEEYWSNVYKDDIPKLDLQTDYQRPDILNNAGDSYIFRVEKEVKEKLLKLAGEYNATLYMVLLSAYNVLLQKYTHQNDIIVGSPISGRQNVKVQNIIGMFVNTLTLRNQPNVNKTFEEFLVQVKQNALDGFKNQDYQFEDLVEKLNIDREMNKNMLFDTMFTLQNMDINNIELEGLEVEVIDFKNKIAKFDISLDAIEDEGIYFNMQYRTQLFKEETIKQMSEHFVKILNIIADEPHIKIKDIDILDISEKVRILNFNKKAIFDENLTLHQIFERQVSIYPNNTAVVYENDSMTYKELNDKANQLARYLIDFGAQTGSIVGIMLERSINMIISVLAVLKAGGTYLPIDTNYPQDRIKYMINDAEISVLLTDNKSNSKIDIKQRIINLDEYKYTGYKANLNTNVSASAPSYIIYTSGTTGNPKGIVTEHRNVINYVRVFNEKFELNVDDATLQQASFTFDGFVEEVYSMLFIGGKIVLPPNKYVKDVKKLRELIIKNNVSILSCSPLILSQFNNLAPMECVHTFLSSSDVLKRDYFSNIIKYSKVYNMYGPTEATVCTTCYECGETEKTNIPIGKPLANYEVYILDDDLNLMPVGVAGEIYISGKGIARGYFNNINLTNSKFIDNPFSKGSRMYKTGDIGRWLSDGTIEFIGRSDFQLKIRGYRVELSDIECQLLGYESINEAVVISRDDEEGNKYLCAYMTCSKELTVKEIRNYLDKKLPEYMIPSYFVSLDKMPITLNGKIDRKALPQEFESIPIGASYEEPRNVVEETIVKLWKKVLKTDRKISINDSFFDLGGNSMKLVELASLINKEFQIEISLAQILKNIKVKELSEYLVTKFKEDSNAPYILFNDNNEENIFCFPPVTGYGLIFNDFSEVLNNYSLYAFNFIESEDRIEKYIAAIKEIKPQGPYTLMGYCVGGRLAFKAVKELEKRGDVVRDLIILDGYRQLEKPEKLKLGVQEYADDLAVSIEKDTRYTLFKDEIVVKAKTYYEYSINMLDTGVLNSDIHLITAEDASEIDVKVNGWKDASKGSYRVYKGFGTHNEMINDRNAEIIESILNRKKDENHE